MAIDFARLLAESGATLSGHFLLTSGRHADTYLEKLCVGPVAAGHVDIRVTPAENVERIADALGRRPNDITVVVLDRPRH